MNTVILLGRAGKDPETRSFESGAAKASFSLATTETFKSQNGERKEVTTWHNIVAWNKTATFISKFVKKGDLVTVTGKINNTSYQNQAGEKVYTSEIIVEDFRIVNSKSTNSQPAAEKQEEAAAQTATESYNAIALDDVATTSDDLPF